MCKKTDIRYIIISNGVICQPYGGKVQRFVIKGKGKNGWDEREGFAEGGGMGRQENSEHSGRPDGNI